MNLPVTIDNLRLYGMYGLKRFEFVADTQNGVEGYYPVISQNVLTWMIVIFVAVGIVGYLLGTLNFAIIISRKKFSEDIRDYGSGNAGMTNMVRTYGRGVGVATFLLDLLKAVLAAEGKVGLMLNARKSDLDRIVGKLPALERPTISPLSDPAWVALNTIVDEHVVRELIPELKHLGASGIVEFPLNKIVE